MRQTVVGFALLCALIPSLAWGAGFAKGSLFFSKTSAVEGDTVQIHAVVSNDTNLPVEADVIFNDSDEKIGTVPVELDAEEAITVSLSWKPLAGTHKVTAEFTTKTGTVVEKQSATFVVAEKASAQDSGSPNIGNVQSSEGIQQTISTYSPAAAAMLKPVFDFVDTARGKGALTLDDQIGWAKQKVEVTPSPGIVAGAEVGGTWTDTIFFALYTLYLYLLTVVRFIIGNAGVFYPVVVILFFFLLWKLLRRLSRPAAI
ncbi:MAG: Ig-like domain-containing protein [Patescibacteria group bacterium]